jgi:hypothetical protein
MLNAAVKSTAQFESNLVSVERMKEYCELASEVSPLLEPSNKFI